MTQLRLCVYGNLILLDVHICIIAYTNIGFSPLQLLKWQFPGSLKAKSESEIMLI